MLIYLKNEYLVCWPEKVRLRDTYKPFGDPNTVQYTPFLCQEIISIKII